MIKRLCQLFKFRAACDENHCIWCGVSRHKFGLPIPVMLRGMPSIISKPVRSRNRRNSNPQALTQLGSAECGNYSSTHDPPSESINIEPPHRRLGDLSMTEEHHVFAHSPGQTIETHWHPWSGTAVPSDLETELPTLCEHESTQSVTSHLISSTPNVPDPSSKIISHD